MKSKKGILTVLALMLAACLSVAAFAETPAETPADSTATDTVKSVLEEAQATADAAKAEDTALKEAMEAYRKAKTESRKLKILTELKEELDSYVAAGSLTQEQVDLILKYYAEQMTAQQGRNIDRSGKYRRGGKGYSRGWTKGNRKGYGKRHGRFINKPTASPQKQSQTPETQTEQGSSDT